MAFRMKKKYILLLICLIGVLLLSLLINKSNILSISTILLVCLTLCIYDAFFKRLYLFFLFEVLTTELFVVMLVRCIILNSDEISWRINYNIESLNIVSLKYIAVSLVLIGIIQIIGFSNIDPSNKDLREVKAFFPKVKPQNTMMGFFNIIAIMFLVLFIKKAQVFSLRNYADTVDTTYIPIYLMIFSVYLLMFAGLLKPKLKYTMVEILTTLVLIIYLSIFIILVIKGYRFILVQISTLVFLLFLQKRRFISNKTIILVGLIGISFYILLLYVKTQYLDLSNTSSLLFGHERNLFFSLNAIIINQSGAITNTYISTFLNLLPKAITNSHHLNVSGTIMQYINAKEYSETGITVGAFYLVEAYLSYGVLGIPLLSILIALFMLKIEKNKIKQQNTLFSYFYIFVGSQMFNIVYYGSLNYIKQIVYFTIMILLLRYCKVIVFDKAVKTKL